MIGPLNSAELNDSHFNVGFKQVFTKVAGLSPHYINFSSHMPDLLYSLRCILFSGTRLGVTSGLHDRHPEPWFHNEIASLAQPYPNFQTFYLAQKGCHPKTGSTVLALYIHKQWDLSWVTSFLDDHPSSLTTKPCPQ